MQHRWMQLILSARYIPKQFLILLAAGILLCPVMARGDSQVRAVRLSNVVGAVKIQTTSDTPATQAYPNMPLIQGSTLQTGEDGRAEVQFEDGSIARLTPNSSLSLPRLTRDASGNTNSEIDLLTGLFYVELSGAPNQQFLVHFGSNDVTAAKPTKFRVNLDLSPPEMAVFNGAAYVKSGDYSAEVHKNETIRFGGGDNGQYTVAESINPDSWDQWNADRDEALGRMNAQETREARLNGNPNNPAWGDLDYYGNWYSGPNGMFWAPYGAGPGWDPFGYGYWGYYGGAGYSWISGYPWGWLPYSCGGWNYYGGFGWGWQPNGCGGGFLPMPYYYGYPSGYRPITPPNFHPGRGHLPNTQQRVISVNRGPAATFIDTHAIHPEGRTITSVAHGFAPVPKAGSPGNISVARPETGVKPANGFGQTSVVTPVFRPAGPSSAPSRSTYAPVATAGGPSGSAGHVGGAPSFSSVGSAPSGGGAHMGSSPGASAGGGGGGHVR